MTEQKCPDCKMLLKNNCYVDNQGTVCCLNCGEAIII